MQNLDITVLYVADLGSSIGFYANLLGRPPIEASPAFAMFSFGNKITLGLWAQENVAPPAPAASGGSELTFVVPDAEAVDATHADWVERGVRIVEAPTQREFGYSVVATDPDGHRLRAMCAAG